MLGRNSYVVFISTLKRTVIILFHNYSWSLYLRVPCFDTMERLENIKQHLLCRSSLRRAPSKVAGAPSSPSMLWEPPKSHNYGDRYEPCRLLFEQGIPCMIWGEDALAAYHVPTRPSDLFLLLHDPEAAASELQACGYTRAPVNARFEFIPELSS